MKDYEKMWNILKSKIISPPSYFLDEMKNRECILETMRSIEKPDVTVSKDLLENIRNLLEDTRGILLSQNSGSIVDELLRKLDEELNK